MINENLIFINKDFETKEEVFEFLSETSVTNDVSDEKNEVLSQLNERESQGTTGMMDGFSIPHAKSTHIKKASIIVIKNNKGIEWESMDGELIDFIIAMFIPENEKGEGHLRVLSQVAKMLMKPNIKTGLKKSQTASEIKSILEENIQ